MWPILTPSLLRSTLQCTGLMVSVHHPLYILKDHIIHFYNFDVLQMSNLFSRQCSVCYAFEPMYISYQHICGSTNKRVDTAPHSRIFQKYSMIFKSSSYRASGNGAPVISGCLVSCGFIHHMPNFWLSKYPTPIVKLNTYLHWFVWLIRIKHIWRVLHTCLSWCRYNRRRYYSVPSHYEPLLIHY